MIKRLLVERKEWLIVSKEAQIVSYADGLFDLQKESYLSLSMCSQLSLLSILAISLKVSENFLSCPW